TCGSPEFGFFFDPCNRNVNSASALVHAAVPGAYTNSQSFLKERSAVMTAFTRTVTSSIQNCQLTFMERQTIDVDKAFQQHRNYQDKLRSLGLHVLSVPSAPEFPDAVFVEDTAVIVDELAVIAIPAHPSRRMEVNDLAVVLKNYRPLHFLEGAAT